MASDTHPELGIRLPFAVTSSANARGHTKARSRGPKAQRDATTLVVRAHLTVKPKHVWAVVVTFTRIAPRKYDEGDNLPMAFKSVRDAVAKVLGVSDSAYNPEAMWVYRQIVGPEESAWVDVRGTTSAVLAMHKARISAIEDLASADGARLLA